MKCDRCGDTVHRLSAQPPNSDYWVCQECQTVERKALLRVVRALTYFFEVRKEEHECHSPVCKSGELDPFCGYHVLRRAYDALPKGILNDRKAD